MPPSPRSACSAGAPTEAPAAAPAGGRRARRRCRSDAATGERVFASPLARKIARDSGVELSALSGTGPGGRIRRRDVEAHLAGRPAAPAATAAPAPPKPVAVPVADAEYVDEPNSRLRNAIAARLTESKTTAPHFYLRGSARVDRLLALRKEINDGGDVKVSVNDLVVKAVAKAHTLVPALNVDLDR